MLVSRNSEILSEKLEGTIPTIKEIEEKLKDCL